ncbi:MAG TPA: MarR family transcriptional regulator, partial [Alphaproteobacteria bacterium]|nr:MarR family transcriptional regulator [Alphaproteobacteria bacterium]
HLTDRARATLPRAHQVASEIDRQALAHFTRTEAAHFIDQLAETALATKAGRP